MPQIFAHQRPLAAAAFGLALLCLCLQGCGWFASDRSALSRVQTIAGVDGSIGEPFGIVERKGTVYFSDGQNGKIWRIVGIGNAEVFAEGLDTPSGVAFNTAGDLLVADSGSGTIRLIDSSGKVSTIAGVDGTHGSVDGEALTATFNHPIGVAADGEGRIYVADTYNDRIRVIEGGKVRTLAGGERGFADGAGTEAKFDTPAGIAIWNDKLIVADTGNSRIRVIESDGRVWTLAGSGTSTLTDGLLSSAAFVQPTAVAVNDADEIFVADGNVVRRIGGNAMPVVSTLTNSSRGARDGILPDSRFNRPSGVVVGGDGILYIADSENGLVRRVTDDKFSEPVKRPRLSSAKLMTAEEFRGLAPARWPYDPPAAKRDIAGTLGEIRGEMRPDNDEIWFHNGLDIAGAYGETARFIRDEKVLRPIAAENFGTLRELIRMPMLGYIHIRLGRNASGETFGDERFQYSRDRTGKMTDVRVPRGAKFKAGEPIGTLNPMNHVHLIAGRSGSEMNALDALKLPGISDSRPPVIEKVTIYDQNWNLVETVSDRSRITLTDKLRIVVRAYDQVDGNAERRRLGVFSVGYQMWGGDAPVSAGPLGEIKFDRLPSNDSLRYVYANGSHSGATGETIFNYIATNFVSGESHREAFLDAAAFDNGMYRLSVFASDYFGNTSRRDIVIEVKK